MQERFKQLLDEKNLTATQFASLIKVNASAMSHILNGRSKPSFDVMAKIAQAFPDINLNFLISGKGSLYNDTRVNKEKKNNPPLQQELFTEDTPISNPLSSVEAPPAKIPSAAAIASPLIEKAAGMAPQKKIKRIILFFEDGSFEDYFRS